MPCRRPDLRPTLEPVRSDSEPTADDIRDLASFSLEWLWETDAEGRLVRLSGRYEALTGAPRQAVLGLPLVALLDPTASRSAMTASDHAAVIAALTARTPFSPRTCVMAVPSAQIGRRLRTIRLAGRPRFDDDGVFLGFRGLATDLTEACPREEQTSHAETSRNELLTAATDCCPTSLFIADALRPGWPLIYINSAFTSMTGYTLHEAEGRNCDFLQGPETDPTTVRRMRDAMRGGHPVDMELLNYRKGGTPYWSAQTIAPISRKNRVIAYVGVQLDITETRIRQQEVQRQHRLQALGQLASGVAHEINNLLQPILTFGELVRTAVAASLPVEVARLDKLLSAAERAREVVHNILRFSRNDANTLTELDLGITLAEAVAFVCDLLPATVVVTVAGIDGGLGTARINATELTQVITNLMSNAAQAMNNHGHIAVAASTARVAPHHASVLGVAPGDYSLVVVSDTGPGMSDAVLAHLFEPFFTTKQASKGTGLGLSVVYDILRSWHGTITVSSMPGQGARFTLFIPRLS